MNEYATLNDYVPGGSRYLDQVKRGRSVRRVDPAQPAFNDTSEMLRQVNATSSTVPDRATASASEAEEFEFLYQMEKEAQAGTPPPNPAPAKASWGDTVAGLPITRLAMGAASPVIGAAQLGAHVGDVINRAMGVEPVVGPWIDQQLSDYDAAKKRGMKASGTEGFDAMGLLGSLAPAGAIASGVSKALPSLTNLASKDGVKAVLARMGLGAAQGTTIGAVTPTTTTPEEGYWGPKGIQTAASGVMGGVAPLVGEAVKGVAYVGRQAKAPFTEAGRAQILQDLRNMAMGSNPRAKQEMLAAAAEAKPGVGGVMPTVGEALSHIPESTGIAAHQQAIAKMPGISTDFTRRVADQANARATAVQNQLSPYSPTPEFEAMKKAIGDRAFPLKEEALNAANKLNVTSGSMKGMPVSKLNANLYDVEKQVEGNAPLEKYLQSLRSRIVEKARAFNPRGTRIDANTLANMRDQVKNDISALEGNERVSKTTLQKYAIDAEQAIDEAIDSAGGTGKWAEWRRVYSGGMQELERVQAGQDLAQASRGNASQFGKAATDAAENRWMQPADQSVINAVLSEKQRAATMGTLASKTSLGGADAIPGDVGLHVPPLLYRPAMVANFIMKHFAKEAEGKIGNVAAQQYLDPPAFAQAMQSVPPRYQPMIDALMRQAGHAAASGTARQF